MKQVVQDFRTGDLKVEELPPPALRPNGVLVQTAYSLISAGTERSTVATGQSSLLGKAKERPDLVKQVLDTVKREGLRSTIDKVKSRLNQIKALGYSASGTILAVGEGAMPFRVGDLVACAGAGYASHAEVNFVPKNLLCKIPDGASLEAACYTTVGAIALHGIRLSEARLGETVAVIGLGLVGQLTVQMLKAAGCRVVGLDIEPRACELATVSGADLVAATDDEARSACAMLSDGRGADCIVITAGTKSNAPIELAGELARDRARVIIVGAVGLDVPRPTYFGKELELKISRSYGPGRYDPEYEEKGHDYPIGYVRWTEQRNMQAFLRLIAEGKINTELLTTHRFAVAQAKDAYDVILGRTGEGCCGVVLTYPTSQVIADSRQRTTSNRQSPSRNQTIPDSRQLATGVSFIGAGNFARGVLLPIVKKAVKVPLIGVATATGVSARNTAEQFGFAYSTTDAEQILSDERSNILFIATRHDTHAKLTAEALQRGKAVFVEKPLATTQEDLQTVIRAASKSNGLLMVGFNRRFSSIAREIKRRLANRSSAMTIVYRVNAGQLPADHWTHDATEGGGRVIGEVCHFIDFVQFMTDALPVRVSAEVAAQAHRAGFVDDSLVISLSFADGSLASIIYAASGDSAVAKERVEIFCDRSVATIDDYKTGEFIRRGKKTKLGNGTQDKGHAEEITAFFKAIGTDGTPPIPLDSLFATTRATFAALESARSGQTREI